MSDLPAQHAFDYASLPPAAADAARQAASIIRRHRQTAARSIVCIGTELAATKAALPHGAWLPWLEMEFGWSERTARNFMRVAEFVKSETVSDLEPFDLRALYTLSAPSTSPTVQTAALTLAQSGERVTHAAVKSLRAAHDVVEAKGAAVLRDAVEAGDVSLRDAEPIARLPKTVQREVVADIRALPFDVPAAEILPPAPPLQDAGSTDAHRALVRSMVEAAVERHTKAKPDLATGAAPEIKIDGAGQDEAEQEQPLPFDVPEAEILAPLRLPAAYVAAFNPASEIGWFLGDGNAEIMSTPAEDLVRPLLPSHVARFLPPAKRALAWVADLVRALEARDGE